MSMSPADPADSVFVQKHRSLELRFEFHDGELTQTISDRKIGSKLVRRYELSRLPNETHIRSQVIATGLVRTMVLAFLISVAQIALHPGAPLFWFAFGVVAMALVWGVYRIFESRLTQRRTDIPLDGQTILILQDRNHDEILAEIRARRARRLKTYATIMPAETKRQNLLRLRTLVRMGVLGEAEYLAFQEVLLPAVGESLLRKTDRSQEDADFEQTHLGVRCRFEFRDGYVRYAHSDMTGRNSLTVWYLDLPELERLDQVPVKSPLLLLAVFTGAIGVACAGLDLMRSAPRLGLVAYAATALLSFTMLFVLSRIRRRGVRCTRIRKGFLVLHGAGHDAILSEMAKRKRAAMLAFAELDPLLPLAEQERRISMAVQAGLVSDDEARERMREAEAIQQRLDLDAVADAPEPTRREVVFH